jgi:hypothetical protein
MKKDIKLLLRESLELFEKTKEKTDDEKDKKPRKAGEEKIGQADQNELKQLDKRMSNFRLGAKVAACAISGNGDIETKTSILHQVMKDNPYDNPYIDDTTKSQRDKIISCYNDTVNSIKQK